MSQKLFAGDLVQIAKDLGPYMTHFEKDQPAIILYSYAERYDSNSESNYNQYAVYLIESKRTVSWYDGTQLRFIEANRFDFLPDDHIARFNHEAKTKRDKLIAQSLSNKVI